MYATLFRDTSFPSTLLTLDAELSASAQARGCRFCGGRLHGAAYRRKPRGGPWVLGPEHDRRLSFCCAREGCRRRTTPASVRFLGRRVYLGAVVILAAVLRHGLSARRVSELQALIGADRRTLERWRRWWMSSRSIRLPALVPGVDRERLPTSLLERFAGGPTEQLLALLRWLSTDGEPVSPRGR